MSHEFDFSGLEGDARTMGVVYLRSLVTYRLAKISERKRFLTMGGLSVEQGLGKELHAIILRNYVDTGLLSVEEIGASVMGGMVLPQPDYVEGPTEKYVSPDLWNIKVVDMEAKMGKRVYVLTGVFDVFHGGHWMLVKFAENLASLDQMDTKDALDFILRLSAIFKGDHYKYLFEELAKIQRDEVGVIGSGIVAARVESDAYKRELKGSEPVFSEGYRLGWFEQMSAVKWTTVYPTDTHGSVSWGFGNELMTDPVDLHNKVVFVLPWFRDGHDELEIKKVNIRERQLRSFGFGVVRVPSYVTDVSSSDLVKRLSLKPVKGLF